MSLLRSHRKDGNHDAHWFSSYRQNGSLVCTGQFQLPRAVGLRSTEADGLGPPHFPASVPPCVLCLAGHHFCLDISQWDRRAWVLTLKGALKIDLAFLCMAVY